MSLMKAVFSLGLNLIGDNDTYIDSDNDTMMMYRRWLVYNDWRMKWQKWDLEVSQEGGRMELIY